MAKFTKQKKLQKPKPAVTLQQTTKFIEFYKTNDLLALGEYKENMVESQFTVEHFLLKELVNQKEHDLSFLFFFLENLYDAVSVSKKIDVNKTNQLISTLLEILEKKSESKFILFRLKVLEKLISHKLYVPVFGFYLDILNQITAPDSETIPTVNDSRKSIDYTARIKIDKQILSSRDFSEFVVNKSVNDLLKYLTKYSKSISFPELSVPLIKGLNKFKQIDIIKSAIIKINEHSKYIENKRGEVETLTDDERMKFEKMIQPMNTC
ncbi:Nucleolar complex protein 2 [Cucumispora dikerogammari]|nr:Nucleolar complex protein 2 [Cucumispora dikerogammari]